MLTREESMAFRSVVLIVIVLTGGIFNTARAGSIINPLPSTGNYGLVLNGGFELVDPLHPDHSNWADDWGRPGPKFGLERNSTNPFAGDWSLSKIAGWSNPAATYGTAWSHRIDGLTAGATYVLSAFVWNNLGHDGNEYLDTNDQQVVFVDGPALGPNATIRNPDGDGRGELVLTAQSGLGEWEFIYQAFRPVAASIYIRAVLDGHVLSTSNVYFDDIAITRLADFRAPEAAPEPASLSLMGCGLGLLAIAWKAGARGRSSQL